MANATLSEAWTTIGAVALGSTWCHAMRQPVAPSARAASTYSRAVMRQHLAAHEPGERGRVDDAERDQHAGEPGAEHRARAPAPAPAPGTTAPRPSGASPGRRRARPCSRRPGRAAPPASRAIATETKPATSETRVPQITRESTSRPTLSVPSRWARLGRASALPRFCFSGSYGDTSGAASADDERGEQHHGPERRQARASRPAQRVPAAVSHGGAQRGSIKP